MAIRTEAKLKQMLNEFKALQQRKKLKQKQHYKKASEKVQQQLKKKHAKEEKQKQPKQKEVHIIHYAVSIYNSNLIERETAEEDLYTKNELQNIEILYPEETGRINWNNFNKLVDKVRKTFY